MLSSPLDRPEPVARVADLMSTFRPAWFLCGGWAVDAWLGGQTREHGDVDIAIFRDDERAIFDHLGSWRLVAHDTPDASHDDPWDGRPLGFLEPGTRNAPTHLHGTHPDLDFTLEVLINEHSGGDWVLGREPRVTLPLRQSAGRSAWGVPTAAPELLLFYKATAYFGMEGMKDRPQDEADFLALLPVLADDQRRWLSQAISLARPGHPWLAHLSG